MGKHKPIYDPSTDCGDYVVAVGCHDLRTTGKKRLQKKYYTHTTRPGSLRSMTMDKMFEKWGGGEVLRRAVRGMLPKNRLRDKRLARLKSMYPCFAVFFFRSGRVVPRKVCSTGQDLWADFDDLQLSRALLIRTKRTLSDAAQAMVPGRRSEECLTCSRRFRMQKQKRRHDCPSSLAP